jgi:hypothetical protein
MSKEVSSPVGIVRLIVPPVAKRGDRENAKQTKRIAHEKADKTLMGYRKTKRLYKADENNSTLEKQRPQEKQPQVSHSKMSRARRQVAKGRKPAVRSCVAQLVSTAQA